MIPVDTKWFPQVEKHYFDALEKVKSVDANMAILGTFLFGSQNYGLSSSTSDVDTIAIVIPSMKYIIEHKEYYTNKIVYEDSGHCIMRDIRQVWSLMKNQDMNTLEMLFTPYRYINPVYEVDWNVIFIGQTIDRRNVLATLDPKKALNGAVGRLKSVDSLLAKYRNNIGSENKQAFCKLMAYGEYIATFTQKYLLMLESGLPINYEDLIYNEDWVNVLRAIKFGTTDFHGIPFSYNDWYWAFNEQKKMLIDEVNKMFDSGKIEKYMKVHFDMFNDVKDDVVRQIGEFIWHLNRI